MDHLQATERVYVYRNIRYTNSVKTYYVYILIILALGVSWFLMRPAKEGQVVQESVRLNESDATDINTGDANPTIEEVDTWILD